MDEFVQFGWAKYIPSQLGTLAARQVKAEGSALLFFPAHLIGSDARSMLLLGRMEMALLACGTLWIVYESARALGQSRSRSALVVLILLGFSNFVERSFETRGDPLSVFFAAAALLVAVRRNGAVKSIFAAGVLSGLAFLATQKAIYFNVALGVGLISDAALDRRGVQGLVRGAWLLIGWVVPIILYCIVLGGGDALQVAQNLFFAPIGAASPQIAADYGGLRHFVIQTLVRNSLLYLFCFAGMLLALLRIRELDGGQRVALVFTVVVTALVFAHNQPWPYVFIMALPFVALWVLEPLDALSSRRRHLATAETVLAIAIAVSFIRNVQVSDVDNHRQLALVARAEALLRPGDIYFDGIGMLPDRQEPSTLWLDRHTTVLMLREGRKSELYRIFDRSPPKLIIWSYRMDAVEPLVGPLIRDSYVQLAPNIRIAGVRLGGGQVVRFVVPVAGRYALYDEMGAMIPGPVLLNGMPMRLPIELKRGAVTVGLPMGAPHNAVLLPEGSYSGKSSRGSDDPELFANVYS